MANKFYAACGGAKSVLRRVAGLTTPRSGRPHKHFAVRLSAGRGCIILCEACFVKFVRFIDEELERPAHLPLFFREVTHIPD
jgi:hypothetical protein